MQNGGEDSALPGCSTEGTGHESVQPFCLVDHISPGLRANCERRRLAKLLDIVLGRRSRSAGRARAPTLGAKRRMPRLTTVSATADRSGDLGIAPFGRVLVWPNLNRLGGGEGRGRMCGEMSSC